ncbi:MAG TPA: SulP family inorganic anion transporter [Nitrospiraceae bacterium]|nr:SulP family inorganic anion transporter [Nitrospiraceae bacterium]
MKSLVSNLNGFLKHDGPAGLVVFLIALPLCLGIAHASGAPLFAGILAGIVGGCVIAMLSDSQVSVSGPAAGLAVIVAAAIQTLGSYETFLAAVVICGAIQIVLGIVRAGAIGDYVPNCVIKGMLAGIGLVILLKQIPHALGQDLDWIGDLSFLEADNRNTLSDILVAAAHVVGGPLVISVLSLVILMGWEKAVATGSRFFTVVPGALVVVAMGVIVNQVFKILAPGLYISDPRHLVELPVPQSWQDLANQFTFPDFSTFFAPSLWAIALTLAVVASLETLLSLEAADRIDPYRRISSPSRELWAQGVGNMVSGMLGGLPVTSVVLRTSANVHAGGRTWVAAFVHGLLLLLSALLIPHLLNRTPLASLAAILMMVGYKLTKPGLYQSVYRLGMNQFIPFLVTVLAIVFTDLLKGVLIGLVCGLFFVLRSNHHEAVTVVSKGNAYLIRFNKDATFINKNELRTKLRAIERGTEVLIDGTKALYIDRDIVEVVEDFQKLASHQGITVELKHFPGKILGPQRSA